MEATTGAFLRRSRRNKLDEPYQLLGETVEYFAQFILDGEEVVRGLADVVEAIQRVHDDELDVESALARSIPLIQQLVFFDFWSSLAREYLLNQVLKLLGLSSVPWQLRSLATRADVLRVQRGRRTISSRQQNRRINITVWRVQKIIELLAVSEPSVGIDTSVLAVKLETVLVNELLEDHADAETGWRRPRRTYIVHVLHVCHLLLLTF